MALQGGYCCGLNKTDGETTDSSSIKDAMFILVFGRTIMTKMIMLKSNNQGKRLYMFIKNTINQ